MRSTTDETWIPDSLMDPTAMRRRLLRGGVGFAPILLESVPRSLLAEAADAATMPPLARGGARSSAPSRLRCAGLTPESWADRWLAYDWPVEYVRDGDDATRFDEVFGERGGYPGATLLDVLQSPADSGKEGVARFAVAAMLNAAKGLTPAHAFGTDVVLAMWYSYVALGYCIPTPGVKWHADASEPVGAGSIIQWLESGMRR
jgi:hypothetical protein